MPRPLTIVAVIAIAILLLLSGFYVYKKKAHAPGTNEVSYEEKGSDTTKQEKENDGPTLAKTAYNVAEPYAKKWSGDAVLLEITNFWGTELQNGKSTRWAVRFYSKEKDKDYVITVVDGRFFQDEERFHTDLEPITTDWANSDVAMKTALSHLSDNSCTSLWMGISANGWRIKCSKEEGTPTWVNMDLSTGKYISREEGF